MIAWTHRAVVYRPSAGGTDASGFPTAGGGWTTPAITPAGLNARPDQSWSGLLADAPLGDQQITTHIWFLDAGFDGIEERDVLDITQGPMAPNRYRVHSVTKPTKMSATIHHIEVATKRYEGTLS